MPAMIIRPGNGALVIDPTRAASPASLTPRPGSAVVDLSVAQLSQRIENIADQIAANAGEVPTYIGPTAPSHSGPFLWWDTSAGGLTLWIQD